MKFVDYEINARKTDKGTKVGNDDVIYYVLGLIGESGEVANKVKKVYRDNNGDYGKLREDILDELGDVLWYVTILANKLGSSLEEVAKRNNEKLFKRYGVKQ